MRSGREKTNKQGPRTESVEVDQEKVSDPVLRLAIDEVFTVPEGGFRVLVPFDRFTARDNDLLAVESNFNVIGRIRFVLPWRYFPTERQWQWQWQRKKERKFDPAVSPAVRISLQPSLPCAITQCFPFGAALKLGLSRVIECGFPAIQCRHE